MHQKGEKVKFLKQPRKEKQLGAGAGVQQVGSLERPGDKEHFQNALPAKGFFFPSTPPVKSTPSTVQENCENVSLQDLWRSLDIDVMPNSVNIVGTDHNPHHSC